MSIVVLWLGRWEIYKRGKNIGWVLETIRISEIRISDADLVAHARCMMSNAATAA